MRAAGYRLLAALLPALLSGPAAAQSQPGFDCNLYGPTEACDPYLLYPPGQELRLTIRARQTQGLSRAEGRLNTLRELFGALRVCWRPPDELRSGMELSACFSFKRDGSLLGALRFTYIDKVASQDERDRYRRTVTEGIAACMPLPFAPAFGGAVAGRPLTIHYIDDRNIPRNRT